MTMLLKTLSLFSRLFSAKHYEEILTKHVRRIQATSRAYKISKIDK